MPSSMLWVRADIVNIDDTAGERVLVMGLHDGGCLPVMLSTSVRVWKTFKVW